MAVDAGFADQLKSEAQFVAATVAGSAAAWGTRVANSTILSPLVSKADAQAEANRQRDFMAGPNARDAIVVKGQRRDLYGQAVTINGDRLGYEAGAVVFVIAVDETTIPGSTILRGLKRLPA